MTIARTSPRSGHERHFEWSCLRMDAGVHPCLLACQLACLIEQASEQPSRLRFDSILGGVHGVTKECLCCTTLCSAIHDTSSIPARLYFSPFSYHTTIYNGRYNQCSQWRLEEETVRSGKTFGENELTCVVSCRFVSFYTNHY